MKARDLVFSLSADPRSSRAFVIGGHYSMKCPPSPWFFDARSPSGRLLGVCVFRKPSLPKVAAGYGVDVELVRLFISDEAGKNSESRFIGWCLRYLRKNAKFSRCISYADPRAGHDGTIYRAANFQYFGVEKGHGTRRILIDGVEHHSKSVFDRYGCSGARLRDVLPASKIEVIINPPKHVWLYPKKTT